MSKDRATQLVEAGIWLKLSGDIEGARKLFERALKLDPGNEKAGQLLAGGQGAIDATQPSGVKPGGPAAVPQPPSAPPRAQADWQAATGYLPVKTPAPTMEGGWGRGTPIPTPMSPAPTPGPSGWDGSMTVTISSNTPVPQPAPQLPAAAFLAPQTITLGAPSPIPQPVPAEAERPDAPHRAATMRFARPSEVMVPAEAEAPAWDVPAWDTTPVAPVAAQAPAWPETPRGATMQFARPPELDAALKEPRAAVPATAAASSSPQLPPPELDAAWKAAGAAPAPSAAWDTTPAAVVSPMPQLEVPRGGTLPFARPPEVEAAAKAARASQSEPPPAAAAEPAAWDVPSWDLSASPEVLTPAAPAPQPQNGSTMQFARPGEVERARGQKTTSEFSRFAELAPSGEAGRTMPLARSPDLLAAIAPQPEGPPLEADIFDGELDASPAEASGPVGAETEPSPWDVVPWDASAPSPKPQAPLWADSPETAPGRTMVQFERPAEVKTSAQAARSAPLFAAADASAAPPAAEPETGGGSLARFPAAALSRGHTVSLSGDPGPEPTPHSTPPLFGLTAGGTPAPPVTVSLPKGPASKGGLQALGAMLGPDPNLHAAAPPSSPPLFTGPAVEAAAEAPPSGEAMGFAWAWSGSGAPLRPQDSELSLVPRPSPAFAPQATSAWDARNNPGLQLESVAGEDRALDLIVSSDSKLTRAPEARDQVPSLLKSARALLDLDDHSGAMEMLLKAQSLAPDDVDVKAMRERSEKTLLTMFESKLGRLETVPRVLLKDDEIIWLNLDHRAGFVLAQIDGTVSFDDLFSVSGMSRIDTARILAQLVEEGVISRG